MGLLSPLVSPKDAEGLIDPLRGIHGLPLLPLLPQSCELCFCPLLAEECLLLPAALVAIGQATVGVATKPVSPFLSDPIPLEVALLICSDIRIPTLN